MSLGKSNNKGITFKILTAALFFLELQPYFMWEASKLISLFAVTIPLVLIVFVHARGGRELISTAIFSIIVTIAAITEGNNFAGIISMAMVAVLFLSTQYLQEVYRYFKFIYVGLIGISAIVWVLVLVGVPLQVNEIMPLNSLKDITYNQYPFLVMLGYDPEESIFRYFRFCGMFDEPGVVGTIALLMLLIDRFNLKKPSNIIILVSGLISMSLFFYLGSFLYVLYSLTIAGGNLKIKLIAVFSFLAIAVFTYNYEITYVAIWERLEYDESKGSFTGDNRADEALKQYINQIRWSNAYWYGVRDKTIIDRFSDSASIQNAILKYGLIGCIVYAFFFIFYAFSKIPPKKDAVVCLLFLFITLWQRPGLYSIPYVFLYLVLILHFGKRQVTSRNRQ